MSYTIAKRFKFDAAHKLEGLPDGHQCGRLHGHTYTVQVALTAANLTDEGWVVDFGELKWLKRHIDDQLDHQYLNDVVSFQTTSENLAEYFHDLVEDWLDEVDIPNQVWLEYVRVSETESTYAEYRR